MCFLLYYDSTALKFEYFSTFQKFRKLLVNLYQTMFFVYLYVPYLSFH